MTSHAAARGVTASPSPAAAAPAARATGPTEASGHRSVQYNMIRYDTI